MELTYDMAGRENSRKYDYPKMVRVTTRALEQRAKEDPMCYDTLWLLVLTVQAGREMHGKHSRYLVQDIFERLVEQKEAQRIKSVLIDALDSVT